MRAKLISLLKDKRGASYVDVVIMVLVAIMVIVLALNVFKYLTLKQDLDQIAIKTADAAAIHGVAGKRGAEEEYAEVEAVFEAACAAEGLTVGTDIDQVSFVLSVPENGEYFEDTQKVQLGDPVKVTITCKTTFAGLGALSNAVEINCISEKIGLSRVYWKE